LPVTDLPVEQVVEPLRRALADAGHAVLQAPPGAGKTTIVPLRLLDEGWLDGGRIVLLEPRRLAARAAAHRMAALLGEDLGSTVGLQTRDERRIGRKTRIEVVTEGILTRRLQRDPSLPGVGLVVFDEVHERNLQADLGLAFVLDARPIVRPDLRVLAMSATLDAERFGSLIGLAGEGAGPAPVVTSEGRTFSIDVRWRPMPGSKTADVVITLVREALSSEEGDVLAFLPGAADIRRVEGALKGPSRPAWVDVRPLFGALSLDEQDLALLPSPDGRRKVVLATDIAETSLTVEGVRVVVDGGQVRTPHHDVRTGLTRLRTGACSKAAADQRAGRAGRTEPGVAYRGWSEGEHGSRPAFAAAEIATADLTSLALEVAVWGTPAEDLALLDQPPAAALEAAQLLLHELGAVDGDGRATPLGRRMVGLPVHPRLARMLVQAEELDLVAEACAAAAVLEERDVLRGRPHERPADLAERIRLVLDPDARGASADRDALRFVRRRATELARRLLDERRLPKGAGDDAGVGRVLALAYPDRLAQATGGGRFRMRHGAGGWVAESDALAREAFLVVAEMGEPGRDDRSDHRILIAAALDEEDLVRAAGDDVERTTTMVWDRRSDDLRVRTEARLGALVLTTVDRRAEPGDEVRAALLEHVRSEGVGVLRWSDGARALQSQIGWARLAFGDEWPAVGDDALLESLDEWLEPRVHRASSRKDLERVDVRAALLDLLGGRHRLHQLEQLVPKEVQVASGRTVPVSYAGEQPSISVRPQDLYGTTEHPSIAGGRVPLVVELLSPAGRPIQVTADLPGLWAGSWSEVRKDMAGRYPKHDWPQDPASAAPSRRGPRGRR
jgi:ATP-dependent helicase HrpB